MKLLMYANFVMKTVQLGNALFHQIKIIVIPAKIKKIIHLFKMKIIIMADVKN